MRIGGVNLAEPKPTASAIADDDLFARYLTHRSPDDLEEIVRRYQQLIYRIAFGQCGSNSLSEDATQEAFLQLTRPQVHFQSQFPGSFRSWFIRLTINVTRRLMRKEGARSRTACLATQEESCMPAESEQTSETKEEYRQELRAALESLSDDLRLPVILHFLENLPQGEIGKAMGVTQAQISRRIAKGLEQLRKHMAKAGVSATMLALPEMLRDQKLVPISKHCEQSLLRLPYGGAKASLQIALETLAPAKTASSPAIRCFVLGLVCLGVAIPTAMVLTQKPSSGGTPAQQPASKSATPTAPAQNAQAIPGTFTCNFDTPATNEVPGFKVVTGTWRWVPGVGRNGSGAMEFTSRYSIVEITDPLPPLPWRITFESRPLRSPFYTSFTTQAAWSRWEYLGHFRNIGVPHLFESNDEWAEVCVYLTELTSDTWMNGKRTNLSVFKLEPASRLQLFFSANNYLDNLKIESIKPEDCPDISVFLEVVKGIKPVQAETTVLPTLKSAKPGLPVTIQYYTGPLDGAAQPDQKGHQP